MVEEGVEQGFGAGELEFEFFLGGQEERYDSQRAESGLLGAARLVGKQLLL